MGSKVITILFVSLLLGILIPAVLPDSEMVRDSSFFISLDRITAQGPAEIKLTASDLLAGAQFGHTVALDGDTAVIGAPGDNSFTGAAYIFSFNGANWSQVAKLTASDGQAGDVFGRSVALDGNTIVIGANGDDEAGGNAGAAYVFQFNGTTWTETAKLTPSVAGAVFFGWSVALDGQKIAVGAPYRLDQGQVINTGAVYIYQADGNNWVEAARLSTSSSGGPVLSDLFGWAVALDGATLVVGSYLSDQAHVFTSGGAGWTKTTTLSGSDTVANDRFGWAVAIEDSTIVVGAVQEGTAGVIAGAAYLFQANGNDWTQTAKLIPAGMSRGSRFGWSVDLAGETVVVSARESQTPLDHTEAGSVYVFEFDGSGWGQGVELYASDAADQDHLGNSVSLSGEFILAGAPGQDGAGSDVGAAYLFVGDGGPPSPPPNQPPIANFSYQGLGHLHHTIRESKAYGVSADGSVVVGYSSSGQGTFEAFRWAQAGGMVGLGSPGSRAHDVSADGSVVVGYSGSDSDPQAFRWSEAGGMVGLFNSKSRAYGVSTDGSVVVGERASGSDYEAFRWTEAGGMVNLGFLPGNPPELSPFSYAWGASADGSVVVGGSSAGLNRVEAFRWTQAGGMVGLGDLPGGNFNSGGRAVSADGSVVVGYGRSDSGPEAFRWTQAGGMVGLGDLPGGNFESYAWGASADGSVVVGWGTTHIGSEAFIWNAEHGMRNLKSVLTAGGLDLTGWTLSQAWDISADGLTIVGFGINPAGQTEAWRVTLSSSLGDQDEEVYLPLIRNF